MLLTTIVSSICLGILAQILADRIKIPAILPLLGFGMLLGPHGLAWFHPASLGKGLDVAIELGIAIILFEGGLTLDLHRLRIVGAAVRNLLTIGVLVSWAGAAAFAHLLADMPWQTSILFGAILTVTGPTVILPLLRHLVAPRHVKTILLSEGLIVDPIGAVLAYFALQSIERVGLPAAAITQSVLTLTATGMIVGFASGSFSRLLLRSHAIASELKNVSVLAVLVGMVLVCEHQAPQSGILGALVMGMTLAGTRRSDIRELKSFKIQISTLAVSSLFILLAGQLDLTAALNLGWTGLSVAAGITLIVRPLSVFASIRSRKFRWDHRLVLALTAPRGIVAAGLGSLAARQLAAAGIPGAETLESLVYTTIVFSCVFATIMSIVLPVIFGYTRDPTRKRIICIGAGPFTEALLAAMQHTQGMRILIDSVDWRLTAAASKGIYVICGDARDVQAYDQAGIERDSIVIAATTNDELNMLVADLVHHEFGIEHPVVVLHRPPAQFEETSRRVILLGRGRFALDEWDRDLNQGAAAVRTIPLDSPDTIDRIRHMLIRQPDAIRLLIGWKSDRPDFSVSFDRLDAYHALTCIARTAALREFDNTPTLVSESDRAIENSI